MGSLWFLLIELMFLSVVGDYPCQALGIWAMLFAGYGIGSDLFSYCGEIIVEPNKEHFFPQMIYPNEWDFYACRECNRLKGQHICGRYQGI